MAAAAAAAAVCLWGFLPLTSCLPAYSSALCDPELE